MESSTKAVTMGTTTSRTVGGLPAETSSFLGRRSEVAQIRNLLSHSRLVTLTGPAGIGKTRLALHAADQMRRAFPSGLRLASLAPLPPSTSPTATVLTALGLAPSAGHTDDTGTLTPDGVAALAGELANRRMLLVLDNCDHLVQACAVLVNTLIGTAPHLAVIATSRQTLKVAGESVITVPPLSLPDRRSPSATQAVTCDAVALFTDRAGAVRPDFTLTDDNAPLVAQICHRLDGTPLAIELAALRLRALSPSDLLHRLKASLHLLTGGLHANPPHQHSLRTAVAWSYDLCTAPERQLWQRLSVFDGTFDLPAAEHVSVGADLTASDFIDHLAALVDKSVLTVAELEPGARYRLPGAAREYGREQLSASGQEPALRERHRDWYIDLVRQAEADWFGPRQHTWGARLHADYPNLRAALQWSMEHPEQAPAGLELAIRLWNHPLAPAGPADAAQWLARGLETDDRPTTTRARALALDGRLALLQGDLPAATDRIEQLNRLLPQLDDHDEADHQAATALTGMSALVQGHPLDALPLLHDTLEHYQRVADIGNAVRTLTHLTIACFNLGDPAAATHAEHAVALCRAHDARCSTTEALWALALARLQQGRPRSTTALIRRAIRHRLNLSYAGAANFLIGPAECLEVLAWSSAEQHGSDRAAMLLGAARTARGAAGRPPEVPGHLRPGHDRCEALARRSLSHSALRAAIRAGARLIPDRALAFALESESSPRLPPEREPPDQPTPLTRRESDVVALVAIGLTNKEIAAKLVVSHRTVEGHVAHILSKLGFTTRGQIIAWKTAADR
ncbi:LuxR C-terminal-related transcriptional regulator [Kitasatospora sp. NPDC088346]|uniref:LuxR C-terminal-related transcriptional regulator n=1 Tax=Kitasatospora sp. NPDC088346 TaxID=3364073 RepID=UPI00380D7F1A